MQRVRLKLHDTIFDEKTFETPQAFLAFMIKIAENEVGQEKRKLARRTDGGRAANKSLDGLSQAEEEQLVDREPSVDEVVDAAEKWRAAVLSLPSKMYRYIAIKLREGFTHEEIAAELDISVRTIGRVVYLLREFYDPPTVPSGDENSGSLRAGACWT